MPLTTPTGPVDQYCEQPALKQMRRAIWMNVASGAAAVLCARIAVCFEANLCVRLYVEELKSAELVG
jgi:hypothetical protein